jgi:hypothetical protein
VVAGGCANGVRAKFRIEIVIYGEMVFLNFDLTPFAFTGQKTSQTPFAFHLLARELPNRPKITDNRRFWGLHRFGTKSA